jgi:hypothetical protein
VHQDVQELKVLLEVDLFQLQLMLLIGVVIILVFSLIVLHQLIMLYLWLVFLALKVSGKLKILGELDGEKLDILDLDMEILVVFVIGQEFILIDQYRQLFDSINYQFIIYTLLLIKIILFNF